MGLSDKEKQVLEELERQLTGEPSKAKPPKQLNRVQYARLLVTGSLLGVFGLGLLIYSTNLQATWLGVIAFILMLTGLYLVSQNWSTKALKSPKNEPKTPPKGENFFQKRWDERNNKS
ncbi:MAG: DUF3040 domain-containing protein [Rhodoluna sp.]